MRVRIELLGAFKVSGPSADAPHLSHAVHRLIATLAAAGVNGIGRDRIAIELWGDPPPESWKSALRNRVTAARRALGSDAILNDGGHFRFGDSVTIDSWDLIGHNMNSFRDDENAFSFLEGEPLLDFERSDLLDSHARTIVEARVTLVQKLLDANTELSPLALQSLRCYRREHPTHVGLARQAVLAHVRAGFVAQAHELVDEIMAEAERASEPSSGWAAELAALLPTGATPIIVEPPDTGDVDIAARAALFDDAAHGGNWSLALEIAMAGLPEAELSEGDPPRLALLEAIPLEKLADRQKFSYALAMARHLMYAGRENDARDWSRTARSLASTPDDELQSFIIAAVLGETDDDRTPIPLPPAFEQAPLESVSMRSLQVAVMSHLERAPYDKTAPLRSRFTSLVESCGRPYRRWHLLLLESMGHFVDGELKQAAEAARTAFKYSQLFSIRDAEHCLLGQLSNARLLHDGFEGVDEYHRQFPIAATSTLGRAVIAVTSTAESGSALVDDYVNTFNYRSRTFFAFPMLALLAPHVSDPGVRSEMIERLRERTGTSAIYGTGVIHLGPVDRVLARMVESDDEAATHLANAVAVADLQQTRLWQVVCRLDLAALTGDESLCAEASDLATTVELEQLTAEYRGVRSPALQS